MIGIEGIETGYEQRYDFALPGVPTIPYLLAAVPRSGSTYLSHLLWQTGCLGAPLEYLNFDEAGPYGFAHRRPDQQIALWRQVLARRTSPNGVFGVKCFPMQLDWLEAQNMPLLAEVFGVVMRRGGTPRMIWLARRDRRAHEISYARAILSGAWRWEQERDRAKPPPGFDAEALALARKLIDREEAAWGAMVHDMRLDPLRLYHEDALTDPAGTVKRVADYLGVTIDPARAAKVPEIRKQSTEGVEAWHEAAAAFDEGVAGDKGGGSPAPSSRRKPGSRAA